MRLKLISSSTVSSNIIILFYRDRDQSKNAIKPYRWIWFSEMQRCYRCGPKHNWTLPLVKCVVSCFKVLVLLMTVIVCLFIRVPWLVCRALGSRGCYIVWCLHLGPFSSAAAVHRDYSLFSFQKPRLPSKWGIRGKKKKRILYSFFFLWKCRNVLNITSHSTGMFLGICFFGLLFFLVYSLTAIFPQGIGAST